MVQRRKCAKMTRVFRKATSKRVELYRSGRDAVDYAVNEPNRNALTEIVICRKLNRLKRI